MNTHKKQFLIGDEPAQVTKDWKTVPFGAGLFLSHCPDLPAATAIDSSGKAWHLLGIAVQTDPGKKDPLAEITGSSTPAVPELYTSWAGRWVLVSAAEIHMDCCGLLGCFYTTVNGARWVSSSLALLQQAGELVPHAEPLKHKTGVEWYPLPLSRFKGVFKLLPSQVLHLKTFDIEARPLPKPVVGLPYEAILEKLTEKLKRSVIQAAPAGKRIFIPLTAGYDSRVVLAAASYAGVKAESYTTGHGYISHADVSLPFKLSKAAGYRHNYIKPTTFSKEKEIAYDDHTARNVHDIDRSKFAHGQWDPFGKGDLILRGGIFEIGRCFYWRRMGPEVTMAAMMKVMRITNPESDLANGLSEWVRWMKQTPTEGLDWRDRFYLEQRVAGWLSAIEQSLDVTGTERFYIINCHDVISLLLSIPVEKRKTSAHHIDLIRRMAPALLKHPFNPPDPKFKRLQKRFIKIGKMPLRELYAKLKRKIGK